MHGGSQEGGAGDSSRGEFFLIFRGVQECEGSNLLPQLLHAGKAQGGGDSNAGGVAHEPSEGQGK